MALVTSLRIMPFIVGDCRRSLRLILSSTGIAAPELRERVTLADQPRKLCQRIAGFRL